MRTKVYWCKSEEAARALLRQLAKKGIRWIDGDPICEEWTVWNVYKQETCYKVEGSVLSVSWIDACTREGYEIRPFCNPGSIADYLLKRER